jgi:signal transduction histidine kinase/ActR/RegA family two-component response regulator
MRQRVRAVGFLRLAMLGVAAWHIVGAYALAQPTHAGARPAVSEVAQAVPPPPLPTSPQTPRGRPVRVGVVNNSYPMSFVDEHGAPTGFVVDLMAAIERTMGLTFERVVGTTAEINSAFIRGELDMLQTYAEDPAREDHADFSVPYLTMAGSIFVRRDLSGVAQLDDLRGRRVLVHAGSIGEQLLVAAGLGGSVVHVASVDEGFELLEAGKGDATLATRLRGLMIVHHRGYSNVVAVGEPVPGYDVRYSFAVRDGNRQLLARLNEGLAIIERTGVAEQIYRKWFGPVEPTPYSPLRIALWVAAGLAVALALVVWSMLRQRALAARLREQQTQMHRAQKLEALGTLSSGIAHDFNNILTTIIGNADVLRSELPPASAMADSANDILKAAERAQRLVSQILTFARKSEPKRQVVALSTLVEEALGFLRATTPSTIEIAHRVEGPPSFVEADPTQVHQALMNVVTNAVHAMRGGSGRLEVIETRVSLHEAAAARAHVPPGEYACITLRDTGGGIPPDVLPRIFDPFFTTKPPNEGTGLGLAVVLGIMQSHNGGVTVASAPGLGTEVRLYFPLVERGHPVVESDEDAPRPRGHGHVLLIDDEAPIVRSIELVLTRLGYTVAGYVSAAEALEAFEDRPAAVDVVITDLTMPGMSGLDVTARVRALRPDVPVVLLSGFFGDGELAQARELGVTAVVDKPLTVDTLAATLASCLPTGRAGA